MKEWRGRTVESVLATILAAAIKKALKPCILQNYELYDGYNGKAD